MSATAAGDWILGLDESYKWPLGGRIAALLLTMPNWIARRIDQIALHDAENARRRVSIDFTLPVAVPAVRLPDGRELAYVPLAYLAKGPLRNFDLRDEAGSALPLLTRRENGELAVAALSYLAQKKLPTPLETEIQADLAALAYENDAPAEELLARLFRREGAARPNRFRLEQDASFRGLAERLAGAFLLIVPLPDSSRRRLLKFAYDEPFKSEKTMWQRFSESLSWQPTRVPVRVRGLSNSASYHIEAQAPPELLLCSGCLLSTRGGRTLDFDEGPRSSIHLMTPASSDESQAVLRLMAPRSGIIRVSFLTSLLTAVVLTGGGFRLSQLVATRDGVATVLVSLPALIAAYVSRPGEHALASRLLFGVRSCVFVSGAISFAASALLLAGPGGPAREATWWGLDGGALLMAVMLATSLARSRRLRERP